jgi:hypothetical protein
MKWLLTLAVGAVAASAATDIRADGGTRPALPVSEGTLLYLDKPGWSQADSARKVAIAADFMRVFCGDPNMPAIDLVDCLDRSEGAEPLFERALSCVAAGPAGRPR